MSESQTFHFYVNKGILWRLRLEKDIVLSSYDAITGELRRLAGSESHKNSFKFLLLQQNQNLPEHQ